MKLESFIHDQFNERYKHFIIYGPPLQGKTKLALDIANICGGAYINLLEVFNSDIALKESIDVFGPDKLVHRLNIIEAGFVVVDQIDFLLNTWNETQIRELLAFVDQNQSKTCYCFIMHNYRLLEQEGLIKQSDRGHERLLNIFNLQHGGMING